MRATPSQLSALRWLIERNGDGVFDRNGVLIAAGQKAPVMRSTWNALRDLGLAEFYLNHRRVRVTDEGGRLGRNAPTTRAHDGPFEDGG